MDKSLRIGVIGCGRVGSVIAAKIASDNKTRVLVWDKIKPLAQMLAAGIAPFPAEPGIQEILFGGEYSTVEVSDDFSGCDAVFIVVNTPSNDDGTFNHSRVSDALSLIPSGCWAIIVSTLSPGTCQLWNQGEGRKRLVYAPAFIKQGSILNDLNTADFALVGSERDAPGLYDKGERLPEDLVRCLRLVWPDNVGIKAVSLEEAELVKVAINGYLTSKIAFGIAIAERCRARGLNAARVLDAIGTDERIGHGCLRPGGTYGGPCLPRDSHALAAACESLREAMLWNEQQCQELVDSVCCRAKINGGGPIGVIGLTYKPGTDITTKSFGLRVAKQLTDSGYEVKTYDLQLGGDVTALSCDITIAGLPLPFETTINVWEEC